MRIAADIILIISAFLLPWWITALLAIVALFYFDTFYESIVVGLIIDSLYNAPVPRFNGIQFVITFSMIILFCLSLYIKDKVRFER